MILKEITARTRCFNLKSRRHSLETIRAMILIRLAISIFALMLIGTAFSFNLAQSQQDRPSSETAVITRQ
jgi:hypothetical protein